MSSETLVHADASTMFSLGVWILDRVHMTLLNKTSLLGVGAGGVRSYQSFLYWGLGAGFAAYLGGLAKLVDVGSITAIIAVGVGWPLILPRLITLADTELDPEQPDAEFEEEEEEE